MGKFKAYWRNVLDIRDGEYQRTAYMGLYLLLVLFAYYILKPVSRAMFLAEFDIDKLPVLYIFIAAAGGTLAYLYTKIAIRSSLKTAVTWCTAFMIGCLLLFWWLLSLGLDWMLYAFSVFVSLFSITLVSQGWLIAANIFTTREAKRVFALLGLTAVLGAAFGGTFTSYVVHIIGARNLLLASAFMVVLAYACFLGITHSKGVSLAEARAAEEHESFKLREVPAAIKSHRHLQVIMGIITLTYIVDVMVEYQFNAMAKELYGSNRRQLTAFLGSFYGIWLNLFTFVLQFFLTTFVVSRFGVGGALQIMPFSIAVTSLFIFSSPTVTSTGAARLTEAATRYSFNRTGMELLYLPLPTELKNRTKAFMDISVDRFSRGLGGLILLLLTTTLNFGIRQLSLVVFGLTVGWMLLSWRARNEYIATVRTRLAARRLDLDSVRVNVREAATIRLLEQAAESDNPRQATYALSLLADVPGYTLDTILRRLVYSPSPEVRAKVFDIAQDRKIPEFYEQALSELRSVRAGGDDTAVKPAVRYALAISNERDELAKRLLTHSNHYVTESAIDCLTYHPEVARPVITKAWIMEAANSDDPNRRVLAAIGEKLYAEDSTGILQKLLLDPHPAVSSAAVRTAAATQNRAYLDGLLKRLAHAKLRGVAIEALASFGERIVGTLGDVLLDDTMPLAVRRQIPRVLQRIPHQRSVDVLLEALALQDLTVRSAVLKALNKLRETHAKLTYGRDPIIRHIWDEARYYYQINAALAPFREKEANGAARLLAATLQERLRSTLERLFRLLGLRYPQREIHAAYLAVHRRRSEEFTAAIEFLDNILEPELKKVLLPLLDDDVRVSQRARELFGIENMDARSAVRELLRAGDSWLVSCAVATAAELNLRDLAPEIVPLSERAGTEVGQVAKSALAVFAS